ncbi:ATP-binding protein [Pseudomonadota bacterium]
MSSIRKRLLFNLLTIFLFTWLTIAGITYYEATHEIEELFDAQLAQTTGMIAELTLNKIEKKEIDSATLTKAVYGHKYERKVSFQIWADGQLLLHSQSAPHDKLSTSPGFSDKPIEGTTWRVFGMQHDQSNYTIFAAENYEVRNEMVTYIAQSVLLPLLWALPLLGVFIWLGIGQGLRPLQRVAQEVAEKNPQQLKPIESENVPDEVIPLTTSLNDLLQRLHQAFELEKRFTADASHELRTPLAGIRTQTQVALRSTDPEEQKKALLNIVQGVDQSSHLVDQMLTLARLEPDTLNKNFSTVDMLILAENVIADLVPLATEQQIELSLTDITTTTQQRSIKGYEPGLAILLRNLIDNAIRYTPNGGTVELTVFTENNNCNLAVTDSGPGIPKDERERIFDRFYRQENHNNYGCGLGLSIVQRIADLHNAEIRLADGPNNRGLSVTLVFPHTGFKKAQ